MLADYYRKQSASYGYVLHEIDGTRSADEMTDIVDIHFAEYLETFLPKRQQP